MGEAQNIHERNGIATIPQLYKEAMDNLSSAISACVKSDLLAETEDVPVRARKLIEKMQTNIDKVIADAKQALREAISTAEKTREPGPLADCLHKRVNTDNLLRDPCADLIKDAETLLQDIRRETVGKGACTYTPSLACNHRHKTLARHVRIRMHRQPRRDTFSHVYLYFSTSNTIITHKDCHDHRGVTALSRSLPS